MSLAISSRPAPPLVVFTDLDGSLLDARTYSPEPAREALARLAARGVPVVFCSSKSAAEQRPLRRELGLEHAPFIVENGAAVIVPEAAGLAVEDWPRVPDGSGDRVCVLGLVFAEVKARIGQAAAQVGVSATGYADLSVQRIAEVTGLDEAAAARAQARDYSETLIDQHAPAVWSALGVALAAVGLSCRSGGRFRTVTGAEADKGRAVRLVTQLFSTAAGRPVTTAGLGDAENDESLLLSVDRPFLLPRDDGTWADIEVPGLCRLGRPGPLGWHDAILTLLGPDLLEGTDRAAG